MLCGVKALFFVNVNVVLFLVLVVCLLLKVSAVV